MGKLIDDKLFDLLINKYKPDDLVDGSGSRLYYMIPKELIDHTDIISDGNYVEVGDNGWFIANRPYLLERFIGWTAQMYFDIFFLNINDTKDRPLCPNCGKLLKFNRISSGYGNSGHSYDSVKFNFCSIDCQYEYRSKHIDNYYDGFCGGFQAYNETQRSRFINQGDPYDNCYFYIASTEDSFKFGITDNIDTRLSYGAWISDYKRIKVIFTGYRYQIANLEYLIKCELQTSKEFLPFESTFKFRQSFRKFSSDLTNLE